MMGLGILLGLGLFFILMLLAGKLAYRFASRRNWAKKWCWLMGFLGAFAVWNTVFYETIPTNIAVRYLCATEGGPRVYGRVKGVESITTNVPYKWRDNLTSIYQYVIVNPSTKNYHDYIYDENFSLRDDLTYYGNGYYIFNQENNQIKKTVYTPITKLCENNKLICTQQELTDKCQHSNAQPCDDGFYHNDNGNVVKIECTSAAGSNCTSSAPKIIDFGLYEIHSGYVAINDKLSKGRYFIKDTTNNKILGEWVWFRAHRASQLHDKPFRYIQTSMIIGGCPSPSDAQINEFTRSILKPLNAH